MAVVEFVNLVVDMLQLGRGIAEHEALPRLWDIGLHKLPPLRQGNGLVRRLHALRRVAVRHPVKRASLRKVRSSAHLVIFLKGT